MDLLQFDVDAKQLRCIQLLLEGAGDWPKERLAKTVGVSRQTVYRWLDDKDFLAALKYACDKSLVYVLPKVDRKTVEAAIEGDSKDRRTYYDRLGLLTQKIESNVKVEGSIEIAGLNFAKVPERLTRLVIDIASDRIDPAVIDDSVIDGWLALSKAKNVTPSNDVDMDGDGEDENEYEGDSDSDSESDSDSYSYSIELRCSELPIRKGW